MIGLPDMEHHSVYVTLTKLCDTLVQSDAASGHLERGEKHTLIKKLRSNAFAVLLKKKNPVSLPLGMAREQLDVLVRLRMRALALHLSGRPKQAERLHCCVDRLLGDNSGWDPDFVASLLFLLAYSEGCPQEERGARDGLHNYLDEYKLPYNKSYNNVRPYREFSPDVFAAPPGLLEQTQQQASCTSYQFLPAGGRFPFHAEPGTDLPLLGRFIRKQRVGSSRYATLCSPESSFSIPELSSPRGLQIPKLTASSQELMKDEGYGTPSQEYADMEDPCQDHGREADPLDGDVWDHVLSPTTCDLRTWESVGEVCSDKETDFLVGVPAHDLRHVYMAQVLYQLQSGVTAPDTAQPRYLPRSQVLSHLKYLAAGIESTSFYFDQDKQVFELEAGVCMEGMAPLTFSQLCEDFRACGTLSRRLHDLVCVDKPTRGLVYQAACRSAWAFLVMYRHTLLSAQVSSLVHLRTLLDTYCPHLVCVSDMLHAGPGAGSLLAHLCQQLRATSRPDVTCLLSSLLLSCCRAYFSFVEKWIFEGACSDTYGEFFIQAVPEWQGCSSRSYWSKGFCMDESEVPTFLHGLQDSILQCAKTVALLKRCNSKEALCVAGERGRPQVQCYVTKDGLARLEAQFLQYEAACRQLCGDPVSVSQLLQRSDLDLLAIQEAMRNRLLSAQRERERHVAAQRDRKRRLLADQRQHLDMVRAHKQQAQREQEQDDQLLQRQQQEDQRLLQLERKALEDHYSTLTEDVEKRIKVAEMKIENARELPDNVRRGLDTGIVLPSPNNNTQENILNIVNIAHMTSREHAQTDDFLNNTIVTTPNGNVHFPDLNSNSLTVARQTEDIDNANAGVDLICHKLEVCGVSNINISAASVDNASVTSRRRAVPDNLPLGKVSSSGPELSEAQRNKRKILYEEFGMAGGGRGETNAWQRKTKHVADIKAAQTDLQRNRNKVLQSNIGIGACMPEPLPYSSSPDTPGSTPVTPQCRADATPDTCTSPCLGGDVVAASGDSSGSRCDSDLLFRETDVNCEAAPPDTSTQLRVEVELCDEGARVGSSPVRVASSDVEREKPKLEVRFVDMPAVVDIADSVLGGRKQEPLRKESTDVFFLLSALRQSVSVPLRVQAHLANCQVLRLLLVQGDLLSHLHSLHRFFFLLDGEFCRSVSRDLFERLYRTQRPSDLLNVATLSAVLSKALCTSSTHNGEHLSFRISAVPEVLKHASPSVLGSLSLHYHVSWPLNIIITDASLEKYNVVFAFLLKLRRLSWVMEQDFHWLKGAQLAGQVDRADLLASTQYHRLQLWRHHMMQVVCALQGYLLGAIQHESWAHFQRALQHAHTLDQLYHLHALYVREVLHRCFLDAKSQSMETALQNLCRVVLKFHGVLRGRQWVRKPGERAYRHAAFDRLGETYGSFQHLCNFVYRLLVKIATRGYQTHVFCLLQALNMNGYYGDDGQVEHGCDP